jgi:hypothetical protein
MNGKNRKHLRTQKIVQVSSFSAIRRKVKIMKEILAPDFVSPFFSNYVFSAALSTTVFLNNLEDIVRTDRTL